MSYIDMKTKPANKKYSRSIKACISNGKRLLEETEWFISDDSPTVFALAILAQEEFAKAFILQLVNEGAIPWTPEVKRSLSSHECKHLMGIIMDWLYPSEEIVEKKISEWKPGNPQEPAEYSADVANAINIFRHEMIEKFSKKWVFQDPEWNGFARKVASGLRDREKQAALYVSIGENGNVASIPSVTKIKIDREIERAKCFKELVSSSFVQNTVHFQEYKSLKDILATMFQNLKKEK